MSESQQSNCECPNCLRRAEARLQTPTAAQVADDAIGLYVEYLGYGHDETRAKAAAILEVIEGEHAREELAEDGSRRITELEAQLADALWRERVAEEVIVELVDIAGPDRVQVFRETYSNREQRAQWVLVTGERPIIGLDLIGSLDAAERSR